MKAPEGLREEVKRTVDIFRGQIVDVTRQIYTAQLSGTSDKLDAFLAALAETTEIIEVARSGVVGVHRGERALKG